MKILIYGNRKQDDEYYDISTPEKRNAAYLHIFGFLDDAWSCYDDLKSYKSNKKISCEPCKKDLCRLCEKNDCSCEKTKECKTRSTRQMWEERETAEQCKLYKQAKKGDAAAAIKLLQERRSYEYENVREEELTNPLNEVEI